MVNENSAKLRNKGKGAKGEISLLRKIGFSIKEYRDGAQGFPDRPIPITRPDPVVSDDNGAPEWTVERILDSRKRGKRDQYLVLWRGYPLSEATWEPIENMDGALDLVIEYNKRSKAVLGAVTTNMPRSAWVKPPRISSSPSRAA